MSAGSSTIEAKAREYGLDLSRRSPEAVAVLDPLQHELDHLDGMLILDRVASARTDVFRRKRYADPGSHLR